MERIEKNTHGFTRDGIPEVKDVVRIDVVGGFAVQKVTSERSYFRTIATVDLKLDFVPPFLINFISRQLIGIGFRLYQKTVASVSSYDEDYSKVLEDPMYARIREVLYSIDEPNVTMEGKEIESDVCLPLQEHPLKDVQKNLGDMEQSVHGGEGASESRLENAQVTDKKGFCEIEEDESEERRHLKDGINSSEQATDAAQATDRNDRVIEILQNNAETIDRKAFGEIEEEESDDSVDLENGDKSIGQPLTNTVAHTSPVNYKTNVLLSPEVERALATLEKAISLVRDCGIDSLARFSSGLTGNETPNLQKDAEKDLTSAEDGGLSSDTEVSVEIAEKGKIVERTSHESRNSSSNCDLSRCAGSNSYTREGNHNKIAPASPEQHLSSPSESNQVLHFSKDGIADDKQMNIEVNGIHENSLQEKKKLSQQKNHMLCCFGLSRR